MNFNALLYYKNIGDICRVFDKKTKSLNIDKVTIETLPETYDKALFLFCQATETYCKIIHNINSSLLPNETKNGLIEATEDLKQSCDGMLDALIRLKYMSPDRVDPTGEFINLGRYLYRNDISINLRDALEKEESQHRVTMSKVREYKNAIVNGSLMTKYNMAEVADATHQLVRHKVLISHCLAPATMTTNDNDLYKIGKAVQKNILEREMTRQVSTALTQQGFLCTLYSQSLSAEEQKQLAKGETVERLLANKDTPDNIEEYANVLSLLTTDHTGLIFTQSSSKKGEIQIGKWFNKDEHEIAHLFTFKTHEQWDGEKKIKGGDFAGAIKATVAVWKEFGNNWRDTREMLAAMPFKRKAETIIDSMVDQHVSSMIANIVEDPSSTKFTVRAENKWAIVQSTVDMDFLTHVKGDAYLKTLKNYLRKHAVMCSIDNEERIQWESAKRYTSAALSMASNSLDFIQDAIREKNIDFNCVMNVANLIASDTIQFDDFSSSNIAQNIQRAFAYSDKLMKMAEANEQLIRTGDPMYQQAIKDINDSFTPTEAKRFVLDVEFVQKLEEALLQNNQEENIDIGNR